MQTINQTVQLENTTIKLVVKREDLIHPFVSGNKFRKLKHNLIQAKKELKTKLLTFGGAYSNHIAAVAFAGKENGFETIGIIRGEELATKINENPTLQFASQNGMKLVFVSREEYKSKGESKFLENLKTKYGSFYLLPEGGTNFLAVKGCEEILNIEDEDFDYICCCIGTAGTFSGLINSAVTKQQIIGFSALKGVAFEEEIHKFAKNKNNWKIQYDYHFGGYGKVNQELIQFINNFNKKNRIPLDPIYTGKLLFGVIDMIEKNHFPENSKILVIHSGGLQGIAGMNTKLKKKKWPLIEMYEQ